MKTTKWPVFILIAYFVIIALAVLGVTKLCFFKENNLELTEFIPFALIIAAVLLICQYFLFDIKIDVIDKRPVAKRKITLASIFLALLMAVMTFTAFVIILALGVGKDGGVSHSYELFVQVFLILLFFGSWFFWAYSFLASYKNKLPGEFMRKTVTKLMAGSVMELIIAVPSHIILRNRGDCCAPIASYFGIIMGTTVLLFAFGPGIVFLYLKRMQKKPGTNQHTLDSE